MCVIEFLMKMDSAVLWTFSVLVVLIGVYGVGADKVSVSVKEGDSVTLHTNVTINQDETIYWFYNNTRIAEIDTDVRICTDVQCKERFRDRLKLDHQTGSLTIMNTRTNDSGVYHLEIIRSGKDREKTFTVTVHLSFAVADNDAMKETSVEEKKSGSGLSPGAVAGIVVGVVVLVIVAAAGVRYYLKRRPAGREVTGSELI